MDESCTSTKEHIIQLLQALRSYDEHESDQAFVKISNLDRDLVEGILVELVSELDTDIRYEAAETLVKLNPQSGPELLTEYLRSSDSTLRWVICGILSTYGDERVMEDLVHVLENDPAPDVRMLAAFALGRIGDERAIPVLIKARDNDLGVDFEGRSLSDAATDAFETIN